jgi:hypothetical protein
MRSKREWQKWRVFGFIKGFNYRNAGRIGDIVKLGTIFFEEQRTPILIYRYLSKKAVLRIHGSAFILVDWIRIRLGIRIKIRIQKGQNDPQK